MQSLNSLFAAAVTQCPHLCRSAQSSNTHIDMLTQPHNTFHETNCAVDRKKNNLALVYLVVTRFPAVTLSRVCCCCVSSLSCSHQDSSLSRSSEVLPLLGLPLFLLQLTNGSFFPPTSLCVCVCLSPAEALTSARTRSSQRTQLSWGWGLGWGMVQQPATPAGRLSCDDCCLDFFHKGCGETRKRGRGKESGERRGGGCERFKNAPLLIFLFLWPHLLVMSL